MKARVSGALKSVTSAKVWIGSTLKTISRAAYYNGSSVVEIASFIGPLSVSAGNIDFLSRASGRAVVSASSTATPSGGLSPYTYVWTILTGALSMEGGTAATATFYATLDDGESTSGTARVVVADALGTTAEDTITVALANTASTGGDI